MLFVYSLIGLALVILAVFFITRKHDVEHRKKEIKEKENEILQFNKELDDFQEQLDQWQGPIEKANEISNTILDVIKK